MTGESRILVVDNPYTGEPACRVQLADEAAVSATLDRAREAARAWRTSNLQERMAVCERAMEAMEKNAQSIAEDITRMMGKPLAQATGELKTCVARGRHMISIAEKTLADVVLPPVSSG
jgi:acyl-CoA reductase-like NAD-dependent aldehyde dehydrogenase